MISPRGGVHLHSSLLARKREVKVGHLTEFFQGFYCTFFKWFRSMEWYHFEFLSFEGGRGGRKEIERWKEGRKEIWRIKLNGKKKTLELYWEFTTKHTLRLCWSNRRC
uniref:Uncharacterized protein n=1 Tax=Micrurus lemniscatus lemniscatus TaxID=129467 RepID=A0A2D4IE67_MICLE